MSKETMTIEYEGGQEVKLAALPEREVQLLRRVIEICREAKEAGNYPFGCLLADKEGNIVPADSREVSFSAKGAGRFRATANGDPTSLRPFQEPKTDLFSGAATAIVQASDRPGTLTFEAKAKGVKPARINIEVK